ncbi:alpha/beta hydrolase [Sulfitobacter sp. JB4-11]|uniref:alpha/beta hydrolase n=1 Tax=Sulfitobacter rhodophyticola TaxID=3238304 RepID=UPI00351548A5
MRQDQRRPPLAVLTQLIAMLLLSGCVMAVGLSDTPNLYLGGRTYPDRAVPAPLQVTNPPIFFVTDRNALGSEGRVTGYGSDRSDAMAFGRAQVEFQAGSWTDLVERTYVDRGRRMSRLDVTQVEEMVRFPLIPLQARRRDGGLRITPEARAAYSAQEEAFKAALRTEVKRTGNGRVLVYVHGVGNDFENALQTLANIWHFSGRRSTPVAFTWPAGNGGALGYFQDREAADFSVFHAKEFLRLMAEVPEVEDIDIVAHSRGTSVMTQALREMVIFQQGRGAAPKTAMKTGTLILAAPDLDTGVARQRITSERVTEAFEQVNIYVNPDDSALRLSSFLTKHPRVGAAEREDFAAGELAQLRKEALVHFIRVEGAGSAHSHSYFRQNPAVMSDIVLALRTRAFPGGTLRPLEEDADLFWRLQPNYPLERLPVLEPEPGR